MLSQCTEASGNAWLSHFSVAGNIACDPCVKLHMLPARWVASDGGAGVLVPALRPPSRTTPSGCLPLDAALSGGYPVGRVVEVSVCMGLWAGLCTSECAWGSGWDSTPLWSS